MRMQQDNRDGFLHEGVWITDPTLDVSGTYTEDPHTYWQSIGLATAERLQNEHNLAAYFGNTGGGVMCIVVTDRRSEDPQPEMVIGTSAGDAWGYDLTLWSDDPDVAVDGGEIGTFDSWPIDTMPGDLARGIADVWASRDYRFAEARKAREEVSENA